MIIPLKRELDGAYFRICRDGKWQPVCFSDMTEEEMNLILKGKSKKWLISLCVGLGKRLYEIGDQLGITGNYIDTGDDDVV